ncbi:MAG TPA: IPT/TIG domain-containing protein, partial [Planctomycetota bacterium]|nr:IPT/TIG domain-containing protein [Planctomycetota bacterium]
MRRARIFSLIVALAGAFSAFSPSLRGSEFTRADTDASGALDISDAVRILGYLFIGEKAPPCLDAADSNDSGRVDIADATFILAYLFVGAKAPPPPFLACGADPTPDSLECDQFAICPDSSADRRPVIAHATASPSKLPRPAGDSVFASQIAWDFTDPDSDVETLVVTSIAPDGSAETVEWNAVELGIAGPSGTTVQQAVFTAASPLGSHERRLRLVDAEGNSSDEARVTILLTEGGTPRLDVTSIVPTSGTAGDEVTLRGNGLGEEPGATKVALGGAAADVIDEGIGWVRCQVPVNALTGPVQVSSPRGTAMSAVPFVIRPQVVIASASGGDDPLEPLEKRRFQAVVIGLGDRSVFWYTDGALGGSQASGFIAKDGTYTSPAVPPAAGVVTISCVAQADDSATAKTTL